MLSQICVLLGFVASVRAVLEGHIVGGQYANIVHHSHSAFLQVRFRSTNGNSESWICGASIVNQRIVLTAAHCLHGCNFECYVTITVGHEHNERGKTYATYSFLIHEMYEPQSSNNDICLLKVEASVTLNRKITRVALMRRPPYSEKATVAGWGMIDEIREIRTNWLKYVSQKVWDRNDCLRVFGYLAKGSFCAASNVTDKEYVSVGDSGSALIVRGYIQIGLVSFKMPSLGRNIVIYTDVGYYYDWIRINSWRLYCMQS